MIQNETDNDSTIRTAQSGRGCNAIERQKNNDENENVTLLRRRQLRDEREKDGTGNVYVPSEAIGN